MSESVVPSDKGQQLVDDPEDSTENISQCCLRTVDVLSANNAMMVCSGCKQIIKCFHEERAYKNYRIFCEGRSREIKTGRYRGSWIVIFHSYDA